MKRVVISVLCLLVLISCNAQNEEEVISNKCLEIKVPRNWQVDSFDKRSEKFLLTISEKGREIDKIARMEFYRIEANKNENLEIAFNRLISRDFAIDTLLGKSNIVTDNLGNGFYYKGEVFFQVNRIRKVFYFQDGKNIIIIHCEYPRQESLKQEETIEVIIKSLVKKC